ncbi:Fe-S cluster assembly protein SufD [Lacihabitans sp. LS3-19]|uniref:Fe-S cluster assembly protein SufD n=1 Tax=Lacihabitans sp. LS3-19 TaxID=2487335 RepID=UPI0020CD8FB0|nr:Fe-S cluster assembly protein SufD [Lacihabitans sp. LS3-19]MCP9769907.1 Fe-S cluster assembly protein SufD [Lacihabitans sp. LS3-19]
MSFPNIQAQYEAEFENIQKNLNGKSDSSFNKIRRSAFEKYKSLGLPSVKNEDWKYSNLKGLEKISVSFPKASNFDSSIFKSLPLSDLEGISLCFVNGIFQTELSHIEESSKIKVMSLDQALEQNPEIIEKYYGKSLDLEKESVSALNVALASTGSVIIIPDNSTLDQAVIIKNISDVNSGDISNNIHNLIVIGKNAEVKVVEIFQTVGEHAAISNLVTEIFVDEDARADYYKIQDENDKSYHLGTTQVIQAAKSYFYAATVTINGGFVRNNLNLVLDGEHIESHMFGLYIPNGKQHIDNHTLVDHRKPNCESNELYKGVLMDSSNGVFNGKIFVREDAQKTNAYQNCRNVITSDNASMNSKPQLEIWADDVKCSHGTTTGKLNDEAIFYMQSRGIPKPEAIRLQLVAFAEDVVSQIKIEKLRDMLDVLIENKLT